MSDIPTGEILLIAVLVLVNAVFVAAEIALVAIRRSRVEQLVEEGRAGARTVQRLTAYPSRFLAVIQLGITFVGFLTAVFANETFKLGGLFAQVPALAPYAETLAVLLVTLLISFVSIVFGELVPKTLALAHAERVALLLGGPVDLLGRLLAPVVWVLTRITNAINRLLGADRLNPEAISTEELRILVERGGEQGVLEAEEEQMISAVIELGERRVHEVMVPRVDIAAVPVTATIDEVLDVIVNAGHSRVPVYEQSVDRVVGILYAKDLLPYLKGVDHSPNLRALLRTPVFVPESLSIDDLLHDLQRRKVHIAIVLDEYGGTAGLVTIEDLIEEIVGEIQDEYDLVEEPLVEKLSDDQARVDGRISVEDLADLFDIRNEELENEEYDTVGGLIYHHVGSVPKVGDTLSLNGLTFTVETTDGRRVGKVLAVRRRGEEDAAGERAE
ncbi:MAG: HlyC/CorC family transporter [Chloroflexi bacterium]|nr:HlyC/CorC family transporter [Chloroflexota bacterium]HEV8054240.1 hemolysin family protein [Candidatus Limnocylindrales bacterium]